MTDPPAYLRGRGRGRAQEKGLIPENQQFKGRGRSRPGANRNGPNNGYSDSYRDSHHADGPTNDNQAAKSRWKSAWRQDSFEDQHSSGNRSDSKLIE